VYQEGGKSPKDVKKKKKIFLEGTFGEERTLALTKACEKGGREVL